MDTTLTTMLNPEWWTVSRMLIALLVVICAVKMIKD